MMKIREVIRLIEDDGWKHVRTRGSHRQFNHPVKRGVVTVPGGKNTPLDADGAVSVACKSLDNEFKKPPSGSSAERTRADQNADSPMTMLFMPWEANPRPLVTGIGSPDRCIFVPETCRLDPYILSARVNNLRFATYLWSVVGLSCSDKSRDVGQ